MTGIRTSVVLIFSWIASACGYGVNLSGLGAPALSRNTATLSASNATLSSSSLLEMQNSNTEVSLKAQSTVNYEVCYEAAGSLNQGLDCGTTFCIEWLTNQFTASSSHSISQIQAALANWGSPTGNILMTVYTDNAGTPGTMIAASSEISATTVDNDSDTFETFTFSSPFQITSGADYHLVLKKGTGFTGDASNKVRWGTVSNAGTACNTTSGNLQYKTYGGTYGNATGGQAGRYRLQGVTFSTSAPTASYTFDAGSEVDWELASFSPNENPNAEQGSFTYDIGITSDATASFTDTSLTKAQVRQLGGFRSGRYLHLRATFASNAGGDSDATLGQITVQYVP